MNERKRSAGFTLASICIFTLLLAGCRGTSSTSNTSQTDSRLTSLQQTPTAVATALPVGTKTYIGQVPSENAWIGITTDGKNADTFVTDGSQSHPATFAQWFKGGVNNNTIDTTAADKNGDDHLQAMLTDSTASGTVTMAGGQSIAFTANALPSNTGSATPSATATPTPSASMTPSMGVNPGIYKGTGSANGDDYSAGWIVAPANMASATATPSETATATPAATETPTPGSTPTPTATPSAQIQQAGAVINTKTHDVTTAPTLTQSDLSNGTISIPNIGNFKLVPCQGNQC